MPVSGSSGFLHGHRCHGHRLCKAAHRRHAAVACGVSSSTSPATRRSSSGRATSTARRRFYKPVACEEISAQVINLNNLLGKVPARGPAAWAMDRAHDRVSGGADGVPARAGAPGGSWAKAPRLALPVAVAAAFVTAATYVFKRGMKHYAKNSCNRYRDIGHRN